MSQPVRLSGRVIAAARALTGVSQAELANAAGLSVEAVQEMEGAGSAYVRPGPEVEAMARGLDHFGVIVMGDEEGFGAGVRLKFARQDVRQIVRLEGEGGIVASDDAP